MTVIKCGEIQSIKQLSKRTKRKNINEFSKQYCEAAAPQDERQAVKPTFIVAKPHNYNIAFYFFS